MNKPIYDFFTKDHRRLEDILEQATKDIANINMDLYNQFRVGLLTHIKMEEKILFPAAVMANNNQAIPLAAKLRLDHGAITALMTIPPNEDVVNVAKYILDLHDLAEEEPGGMYDICESLTQDQTEQILDQLYKTTLVPVHPPNGSEAVWGATVRALERAGYNFEAIAQKQKKSKD
ncbi:MAG TPA: hemerythrin domain-containing protein [Edaphocola sp.]|nr:hemerythrin domain-containing protein [Edaphocola sp.]